MTFAVGEEIGPYRVVEQLGQGGMATVCKAYHAALDRYVALKVLHPAFLEDPNFLARFQREARLVAKLEHPHIVPIYDYAEHDGRPYLVMKFIEGETLKARLARGPLSAGEVLRIVEAVGEALAYAHKRGILHRDIKPSNVLLSIDGGIYLADFGLARIAQSGESTLTSDMILGTPQYISPEQALGKKNLDDGTDIYSFGVMLYEMIVGKVPFSADTPFSVIHDHIYSPLPLPRLVNPNVPEPVERVLLKALSKERHDRYKDVHTMVDAFRQAWTESVSPGADEAYTVRIEPPTLAAVPPTVVQAVPAVPPPEAPAPSSTLTPAPVPVPVPAPVVAETASRQPVVTQPVNPIEKPKRKLPWMWIAVGIVLVLGCLVTSTAFFSVRRRVTQLPVVATAMAQRTPQIPKEIGTLAPLLTPQTYVDIAQAEQEVSQNPNDPNAYLKLALAYALVDDQSTQEAVTKIEKLAGQDEGFLWSACGKLAEAGSWVAAARLCEDAAGLKPGQALAADKFNMLHQTVYLAAKSANSIDYLNFENRLAAIDSSLALVAKARYQFYNKKDPALAQQTLDQAKKAKPDLADVMLLQAEFDAVNGKPDAARNALAQIKSSQGVSPWILDQIKIIEGMLK